MTWNTWRNSQRVDTSGNTFDNSAEKHDKKWFINNGYKKDIHYENYTIKKDVFENTVKNVIDKYNKLTEKDVKILYDNLAKGCGPLTDEEIEKDKKENKE